MTKREREGERGGEREGKREREKGGGLMVEITRGKRSLKKKLKNFEYISN